MRRFLLLRHNDISGVSGTGVVAWGVLFPDGHVSGRWNSETPGSFTFPNIQFVEAVHGHDGNTEIVWIDEEGAT